ncbi:MAG TPA: tetratricopeptide repeat protein [Vicinamibacteria bacterium]|nr:tetratricopeptide repeat protein [Vicinamibacteria bacterium]
MRIPRRASWALAAAVLAAAPGLAATAADCGPTAYECALFHAGRRDFQAAIPYLEKQLAASPRDLKALNLLGIALTGAGRREAGSDRFREALAVDGGFVPARKNLAVNEYDAGRYAAARQHLEQVLRAAPADEIAHVYLGEIHYRAKRLRAALAHYEKAGERFAQHPLWTLHYGRALIDAGRPRDALAVLDRLPREDGPGLFEAGVALGQVGAHGDAARFFAAARPVHEDPYAAGFNEALMRIEAGDHEGALRVTQELVAAGHAPAELYNLASRAHAGAGRIQEAYDALRQATRLEPSAPENYIDLATICLEHDNFDLGLEIVDIGLGHLPGSWQLHVQRGVLLAMKGLMGEAEAAFEAARRLAPDEPVPYAALGMVWIQGGNLAKAVETLRTELPRRKDHVVPYIFSVALLRSGVEADTPEADEAVAALRASIAADPGFAPARAELGRLLLKRDEVDQAVRELEKAVQLDPAGTPALYALSQAYRKKGDLTRAQDLLKRVSTLNARERGDDQEGELRRAVIRIVRERMAPSRPPSAAPPEPAAPEASGLEAHLRHGADLDRQGRSGEAVAAFQSALLRHPESVEARFGLSVVLARLGDLDGTIALLRDVLRREPDHPQARYDLGVHLWNRYRHGRGLRQPALLDEAERELRGAVEGDPARATSRRALGQLLAERERVDEAVEQLREAARLSGNDPAYAYDLGLALRLRGDLDGAEAHLRAAIAGDPRHAEARRALGLILRQKGDLPAAATELRASVAERPRDAQAHNVLGGILLRMGEVEDAIAELRRAAQLEPLLTEAHVTLAQALAKAGRPDEARSVLADVRRLKDEEAALSRAMLLLDAGVKQLDAGQAAASVASLREAVAAAPAFAEAQYHLGRALGRAGAPPAEAEEALLQAVRLDPGHALARYEWAKALAARGDRVAAVDQLSQAVERQPSLVAAHRERARLAAAAGDWPAALGALQAALAWEPENARTRYDLAVALEAAGAREDAARELAAARRIDPRLPDTLR